MLLVLAYLSRVSDCQQKAADYGPRNPRFNSRGEASAGGSVAFRRVKLVKQVLREVLRTVRQKQHTALWRLCT